MKKLKIYTLKTEGGIILRLTEKELGMAIARKDSEPDEDYEMLARENKNMAEALYKLGYSIDQVAGICNGKKVKK